MLQRLRHEQQGVVMVLAAVSLSILLMFAGLALDFGRAHLLRAQLQTAVDAAALAGSLEVIPMVTIEVPRLKWTDRTCYDPITQEPYDCSSWRRTTPARVSGTEWDLFWQDHWRARVASQCNDPYQCADYYNVVRRWLDLPPGTRAVAENAFNLNATWPGGSSGIRITKLEVDTVPTRGEVTATATMVVPTSFLRVAGIAQLTLNRTGTAVPVRRSGP
jgi:hypothetical protein